MDKFLNEELFEVVLDNTNRGEKISESKNVAPDLDAIEHKFNPSTDLWR